MLKSANAKLETQKQGNRRGSGKVTDVFNFKEESSDESESSSNSSNVSSSDDEDDDRTPEPAPGSQVLKKKWATHGMYTGQNMHIKGRSTLKAMKGAQLVEKKALPLPMYKGLTIMETEEDFVLPFGIFNLTPWVIPKPPGWKSLKRSTFITIIKNS